MKIFDILKDKTLTATEQLDEIEANIEDVDVELPAEEALLILTEEQRVPEKLGVVPAATSAMTDRERDRQNMHKKA